MADDDQEKTEDPTGKKLEDARKKGQVARSKELGTAAVLITAAIAIMAFGSMLAESMVKVFQLAFTMTREQVYDVNLMLKNIGIIGMLLVKPLMWIMGFITLAALIGNTLLGGMSFSWEAARPKASKMSPLQGFKRMMGLQAFVELIKSIAKVVVIAGVVWFVLRWKFAEILTLSMQSIPGSIVNALDMLQWMLLALVCSLIVIVIIDVPYQIWNHNKQLKMSKQEVKDEHKNMEGSPEVKGRIRRLQMEMAARRMMADVPQADVVVTNPTHFSVALQYDKEGTGAPKVVAKGVDEVAMKIREIARHYEVPIMEAPALTRSLYHTTKIGHDIPEGLYVAVAQILAFVFQLEQYRKGKGKRPKPVVNDLPIPNELRY
ncbi:MULTISPECIES: flagellar biosynthesis protein FlhB [unclassified Agarivorans]|uniref:flagellar biosynthesis protein FlhB n=1 Tax=unclassified Agarivorans TaxID=2636026 RepID=UPI0026E16A7A|nr:MULTISPECIES: flagellar biosynthesis protein FlhB [unclassified Agarivorans]MDO6686220.1 flagellar biosynthesis protein FlhB [Agarivorans sp. 3_MG-2023]MDO6716331.1 flagellar biosynthesis protein FlhB [Agarivorans sp. 2_MG-2023]MDO6764753.1 flagellar biosynthesis protein FlhB [Agarivorans sp. 1_MG-2023]